MCPTCRCKEPKPADNSDTPTRSTANPPQKLATTNDEFVTQRVKSNSSKCSCFLAESIRNIIREELDRKLNTQMNEFKLKLTSLEECLSFYFARNDQLRSEGKSHRASITELQRDNELLQTTNQALNRRL